MEALGNFILAALIGVIFLLVLAWPAMWALSLFGVVLTYWQTAGLLLVVRAVTAILLGVGVKS